MSTYVPPPPPAPPRRGADAAFKWIAAGCGGCLLLMILFGLFIYYTIGPMIGGAMKDSVQLAVQMTNLRQQIQKYKADTGNYPENLRDLVPKYVRSESDLKLSTRPDGPEITYHKPGPNAQPEDVLLEYALTINTPDNQRVESVVKMQINGQTRQGGSRVMQGGGSTSGVPPGQPSGAGSR